MNPIKQLLSVLSGGLSAPGDSGMQATVTGEWLIPISAAAPCGDSLEYDTEYAVLQARLEPKPDVQYGKFSSRPEAPDWAEVERDARRLLLLSKDISILIWFARARCRLAGATGLLEGLYALQAVLQAFPEHVHPQLVLEGAHDPAVRANALAALCDPDGLLGDVREVVVSGNTAFRLSVRDVERALAVPRAPYALDADGVRRQLADLHGKRDATLLSLLSCAHCVQAIAQWSQSSLQEHAPSLAPLQRVLELLGSFDQPSEPTLKLQADALEPEDDGLVPTAQVQAFTALALPSLNRTHALQDRERIRSLLREVRQWIEHHEPSSPVSVLIKQADRMWGKRFSEIATMIPPDLLQAWDRDD